jgi:DNA-binding CsgD family transcriptional regulator
VVGAKGLGRAIVSGRRSRSLGGSNLEGEPIVPPAPEDLESRTFRIGADEYVVFSFTSLPRADGLTIGGIDKLTPTERSVVSHALRGLSNAAIGRQHGTTARTVANQLTVIYQKLGFRSRRELRARGVRGRGVST